MGILLFIVARILQWLLTPVFFIYAILRFRNLKKIDKYFHKVAFSVDQLGNTMGGPIMNDVLITKEGYQFGDPDYTISYVCGVNEAKGTLTIWGRALVWILNKLDPGHTKKAYLSEQ